MSCTGRDLFLLFVKQRLLEDNPELIQNLTVLSDLRVEGGNAELDPVFKGIEGISSEFMHSRQRQLTKDTAMNHSLDVREEEFQSIVKQVVGASTQNLAEHIIVVFFFLYDYVMRMYSKGIAKMDQVLGWCQTAVVEGIDPKVTENGGWAPLFCNENEKQNSQSSKNIFTKVFSFFRGKNKKVVVESTIYVEH
ncbi:uncharacterized protein LOC131940010 [Physella acuta]|uniref:uncharacterized protein LOC131940010 n=1 Tax=Physella acuta TaxID=109671 RepID=UPI0027DAE6BC|nr:uncharacterized protein LOC131940010 [Physella acuta]